MADQVLLGNSKSGAINHTETYTYSVQVIPADNTLVPLFNPKGACRMKAFWFTLQDCTTSTDREITVTPYVARGTSAVASLVDTAPKIEAAASAASPNCVSTHVAKTGVTPAVLKTTALALGDQVFAKFDTAGSNGTAPIGCCITCIVSVDSEDQVFTRP